MPQIRYTPELMDEKRATDLTNALEHLLCTKAEVVWPAAHDAARKGNPLDLSDVEILILPLDRIGAPVGASGASVYIAYYAHSPETEKVPRRIVSHPLAIKIGDATKLQEELDGIKDWPTLGDSVKQRFAFPFHLDDKSDDNAILVAPFRSRFSDESSTSRNRIQLGDLWGLLTDPIEILEGQIPGESDAAACIGGALDSIMHTHRDNLAEMPRRDCTYVGLYERYLRGTCNAIQDSKRTHIPESMFGTGDTTSAFGKTWPNPCILVEQIISNRNGFEASIGPIHGDLHSKNIVLDNQKQVQIIDFGWARGNAHIVMDYLLLDINLRGTTLPSQLSQADTLALAAFLWPKQKVGDLPASVQSRARLIKNVVWGRAGKRAVKDWLTEYLVPMLLVNYGLLVHLDSARNQSAIIASLLSVAEAIEGSNKV